MSGIQCTSELPSTPGLSACGHMCGVCEHMSMYRALCVYSVDYRRAKVRAPRLLQQDARRKSLSRQGSFTPFIDPFTHTHGVPV